jgi:hypothetical protein
VREEFQSVTGIESLLASDTRKLLFRSSVVDGRPVQRDDRAAQIIEDQEIETDIQVLRQVRLFW